MGIVYRVTENTLKREVALKICRAGLPPDSRRPQEASEFANEAYMTAHLDHPGVVPIYALAKDADGRPFFAMKKVSGTSWKDLLHPEGVTDPARRAALEVRARHLSWKDHSRSCWSATRGLPTARPPRISMSTASQALSGIKPQLAGTPSPSPPKWCAAK